MSSFDYFNNDDPMYMVLIKIKTEPNTIYPHRLLKDRFGVIRFPQVHERRNIDWNQLCINYQNGALTLVNYLRFLTSNYGSYQWFLDTVNSDEKLRDEIIVTSKHIEPVPVIKEEEETDKPDYQYVNEYNYTEVALYYNIGHTNLVIAQGLKGLTKDDVLDEKILKQLERIAKRHSQQIYMEIKEAISVPSARKISLSDIRAKRNELAKDKMKQEQDSETENESDSESSYEELEIE